MTLTCDTVIIGAGFAGLAAARSLVAAGQTVIILEASDRAGGRVWAKPLPPHDMMLDWGAEWVIPHLHPKVMADVTRLNLTANDGVTPARTRWVTGATSLYGSLHDIKQQRPGFAAALKAIEAEASLRPATVNSEGDLRTYFIRHTQHAEDAVLLELAVFPLTGADPSQTAVRMLWDEISVHDGSIDETLDGDTHRFLEGVGQIGPALARQLGDCVKFNMPARRIVNTGDGVDVHAGDATHHARACILAAPLRTIGDIDIVPKLPELLAQTAQHSNAGRVAKIWARVSSTTPPDTILHATSPLRYAYARAVSDGQWMLCAQYLAAGTAPVSHAEVRSLFAATWPGTTVTALDIADWPSLPLAQGSWHSSRAGYAAACQQFLEPHGNIHFAGGDIASRWAGWMEGALLSGEAAAQAVLEHAKPRRPKSS